MATQNILKFSAGSNLGHVRKNNEDNLYIYYDGCDGVFLTPEARDTPFKFNGTAQQPCIFSVCDGMGGEADGELASLTAVTALKEHSKKIKSAVLLNAENINNAVQNFILDANERMCKIMQKNAVRMGSTLALVIIADNIVRAYTIGDSRIYKLQNNNFSCISEDHTLAFQKVKMGLITKEEAGHDKSRHVLTRYLGVFEDEMTPEADVIEPFEINKNNKCRLLICSDGLTDMVDDKNIFEIMRTSQDSKTAAEMLINSALKNGGHDNVTCIVIDCN